MRHLSLLVATLSCWTALAQAQPEASGVSRSFVGDRFSPQAGDGDILGVQAPSISPHLLPRVLAWASAAEQTTLTLGGALGLFDRLELGLAVPVVIAPAQVALGDVRVQAKARLFDVGSFSFGASLPVVAVGGSGVSASPTLLAQWAGPRRSAVLLDLGAALRAAGHAFTWALAGKIDLVPRSELSLRMSVGGEVGPLGAPVDALASLRWVPIDGFALSLGAGPGLSHDGSVRFRVVASIGWVPPEVDRPAHPAQSAAADEALRRVVPF